MRHATDADTLHSSTRLLKKGPV